MAAAVPELGLAGAGARTPFLAFVGGLEAVGTGLGPPVVGAEVFFGPNDDAAVGPIPIVFQPGSDRGSGIERNDPARRKRGGLGEGGVRLIDGDVNDIGIRRQDFDIAIILQDNLFGRGLEVAEGAGDFAEALDGVHDVLGLIEVGLSELGGSIRGFHPSSEVLRDSARAL